MSFHNERQLDDIDWRILEELQADGHLSYNELGRRVSLSPPTVAERVRRLEEQGVSASARMARCGLRSFSRPSTRAARSSSSATTSSTQPDPKDGAGHESDSPGEGREVVMVLING